MHGRYVALVLTLGLSLLLALAVGNWFLDPFGLFSRSFAHGEQPFSRWPLNQYARIHKTHRTSRVGADALILGTSRAGIGLPATGAPWATPAYNLAISGASPAEIRKLLVHALSADTYQRVIVTIDFPVSLEESIDEMPALLIRSGDVAWRDSFRTGLLGPLALLLSHKTLHASCCAPDSETLDGQSRVGPDGREWPHDKLLRRAKAASRLDYWREQEVPYARLWRDVGKLDPLVLRARERRYGEELESLFEVLAKTPTPVNVIILPTHPWHLAVMREAGRWGDYERWLDALVVLGDRLRKTAIVDYALADCVWSVASAGSDSLFVDPSHIDVELGRQILADVVGAAPGEGCQVQGVRLERGKVRAHLEAIGRRLERYAAEAPVEYQAAADLAQLPDRVRMRRRDASAWCRLWEKL